ncbi:hypothetical protein ACFQS7_01515 [Dankookia sp. GCM10030260]|uniref:hypothetical protein n=1 Tax=Dankookia sp. GCM10030260 TaxID=3273390 RepID=UPI00360F881F
MNQGTGLHPTGAWPTAAAEDAASGLLGALPEGWAMLGRCRTGTAGPVGYPTGCWALAHPTTGVALVDVAPDATPNAEARLRRALGAANFWPAFPGYLPVWHGRIELAAWRSLPGIMAEGFSELPPLTVPGKGAWIAAARDALAEDGAWDVPGAPRGARAMPVAALLDDPDDDGPDPVGRRPWQGRLGLVLGFVATFAVGLASGVLLLSDEPPAPVAAPLVNLAALPPAAAPQPVLAQPEPVREAAAPVPVVAAIAPRSVEPVVVPPAPPPVAMVTPLPPAAEPEPPAMAEATTGADTGEPMEVASLGLPLPPEAPKAPVQRAARPPERIDRACTQAVFRFQQGLPLSPAEQAHVRNGCATRR